MSDNMTVGSAAYRAALHRWNELVKAFMARRLTDDELAEMGALAVTLDAAETGSVATLTDDYAEEMLRFAGSLGSGVEL